MKRYSACIIGAGSIGALKPDEYDNPSSKNILTHAHAFYKHPQINLIGIIDNNKEKGKIAAKKWSTNYYKSIKDIKIPIDIIVISTPTDTHFDLLRSLVSLKSRPKAVIAEKPFCNYSIEAKTIIDLYKNKKIILAIDYIRRYDASVIKMSNQFKKNNPTIFSCRVIYCRGLKHEGCHAIDFMRNFFGEYLEGKILNNPIFDRDKNDLCYSVFMRFEKCPCVIFTPVDGREYNIFEIDIITNKERIIFTNHGLKIDFYSVEPESVYGDYNHLSHDRITFDSDLNHALLRLVENVIKKIEGTEELLCPGEDGLAIHKILEDFL